MHPKAIVLAKGRAGHRPIGRRTTKKENRVRAISLTKKAAIKRKENPDNEKVIPRRPSPIQKDPLKERTREDHPNRKRNLAERARTNQTKTNRKKTRTAAAEPRIRMIRNRRRSPRRLF